MPRKLPFTHGHKTYNVPDKKVMGVLKIIAAYSALIRLTI